MRSLSDDDLQSLFEELSGISFDETEKPSRSENLKDILEIAAVAAGIKPTHLNGQGFRSEKLILTLEQMAPKYGLHVMRTPECKHFRHREPNYEKEIVRWEDSDHERKSALRGDVLWIYRSPSLRDAILSAVVGHISVASILGYPECCVMYDTENTIRMGENYVEALRKKQGASTAEEVIQLREADTAVEVSSAGIIMTLEDSTLRFPYVQFSACPRCLSNPDSPAALVNRHMRDFAFSLMKEFAQEIWRASYQDAGKATTISRGTPCPCGSGKKYKRCCGG